MSLLRGVGTGLSVLGTVASTVTGIVKGLGSAATSIVKSKAGKFAVFGGLAFAAIKAVNGKSGIGNLLDTLKSSVNHYSKDGKDAGTAYGAAGTEPETGTARTVDAQDGAKAGKGLGAVAVVTGIGEAVNSMQETLAKDNTRSVSTLREVMTGDASVAEALPEPVLLDGRAVQAGQAGQGGEDAGYDTETEHGGGQQAAYA